MSEGDDGSATLRARIAELERKLAAHERRFEMLVDGIQDGVFAVDREGHFLFVNEFIARNSGVPRAAFVGRHFLDMVCPEQHDEVRRNFERALAGERVPPYELAYGTASGTPMWVELNTAQYRVDGDVVGVFAISRNIQRRKQTELALRESEAKYRELIDSLPALFGIVQDGKVVFANRAARQMLGYDPSHDERGLAGLVPPGQRARTAERHRRRVAGEPMPTSYRSALQTADGKQIPLDVHMTPIQYGGRPAYQCLAFDLSETARLERDIQQIQRMDALGALAGGIAHDFNNLLTGMLAAAELLRRQAYDPASVLGSSDVIERAARRAAELTKQLLGFARHEKARLHAVDLAALIDEATAILSRTLPSNIRIEQHIDNDETIAVGDDAQLQQVILNLAINARDAMSDGGVLTLKVSSRELTDEALLGVFEISAGTYTTIVVSDTGSGIRPDVLDHIFEPFYTTKERGRGSGMGLSVVYGIVRAHHGAIEVTTVPGQGTTFTVYLPHDTRDHLERPQPVEEPANGSGVVVLVDDEAVVRETTAAVLESLGYEVRAFGDGRQAVAAVRQREVQVSAALIDVRMPGMDGWQCSAALRELEPRLPVLMMSGNASDPPRGWDAGDGFIAKPYTIEGLASALAAAITSGRASR